VLPAIQESTQRMVQVGKEREWERSLSQRGGPKSSSDIPWCPRGSAADTRRKDSHRKMKKRGAKRVTPKKKVETRATAPDDDELQLEGYGAMRKRDEPARRALSIPKDLKLESERCLIFLNATCDIRWANGRQPFNLFLGKKS